MGAPAPKPPNFAAMADAWNRPEEFAAHVATYYAMVGAHHATQAWDITQAESPQRGHCMTNDIATEGPAALALAATGTLPVWARNERVTYHNGSQQYTYLTTFLSSRAVRELATVADAGWEVTIRGRDTGSVHIRINRK